MGDLLGASGVAGMGSDFDACYGRVDNDESGAPTSMLVSIKQSPRSATNTSGRTKIVSLAASFPVTVFDTFSKQLRSSRSCRKFCMAAFNCPLESYYRQIKYPSYTVLKSKML